MTWLACSSGLWPSRFCDSSNGWHRTCFSFVPFPDDRRAQWLRTTGMRNYQNREFAVHEHHGVALSYWYPRLVTRVTMLHWVCMREFSSFKIHLMSDTSLKLFLRNSGSRICICMDSRYTSADAFATRTYGLWWTPRIVGGLPNLD
jgi:hypothetical protein